MNKKSVLKSVLIILGASAIGFGIYQNLDTIIRTAQQGLSPIANALAPFISNVQNTWATIPEAYKGILIAGVPTAFTLFFAWSKSRAMQKLQQTQLEAKQKIAGVNEQLLNTNIMNQGLQKQVETYQQMPAIPNLSGMVSTLQDQLLAKQAELDSLQTEFNLLERLKFPTVIEKTVVK